MYSHQSAAQSYPVDYGEGEEWSHVQAGSFNWWHNLSATVVNGDVWVMEPFYKHKKYT